MGRPGRPKRKKSKQARKLIAVQMDPDLYEQLKSKAAEEFRSVSAHVRKLIHDDCKKSAKKGGKP